MNSPLALIAAVFHMMNHATFKASLFMAAGVVDHETGTRDLQRLSGLVACDAYHGHACYGGRGSHGWCSAAQWISVQGNVFRRDDADDFALFADDDLAADDIAFDLAVDLQRAFGDDPEALADDGQVIADDEIDANPVALPLPLGIIGGGSGLAPSASPPRPAAMWWFWRSSTERAFCSGIFDRQLDYAKTLEPR